jgi:hypothetical protein
MALAWLLLDFLNTDGPFQVSPNLTFLLLCDHGDLFYFAWFDRPTQIHCKITLHTRLSSKTEPC